MDYLVSTEAKEFLTFTTELYEELGTHRYCTDIIDLHGNKSLLTLTCERFDIPILSICGVIQPEHGSVIIGMWQLLLTREKIKEHLEEELNIYLNNGIKTFGPLLGKALKANLNPDLSNFGVEQSYPLRLVYSISGRQYIGTLQIPLVQSNLDKRIYDMMNSIRPQPDPSLLRAAAAPTSLTQGDPLFFSFVDLYLVDVSDLHADDSDAAKAATTAPSKTKKRTGGVSVNPSSRRKK